MLPMQTNSTRYDCGGPTWRVREFVLEDISASSAAGSGYRVSLVFGYHSAPMRLARWICRLAVAAHLTTSTAAGAAETDLLSPGDVIMIQAAPKVIHFDPSDEHVKYSWLVGVEWQRASRWLAGYSYFNNSFDQKCHYLYGGKSWPLGENNSNWYLKLTGGVIIGYKDPYEDKLPINSNGVGPVIIPALGYKFNRFNVQANLLGANGLMITVGYDLFR